MLPSRNHNNPFMTPQQISDPMFSWVKALGVLQSFSGPGSFWTFTDRGLTGGTPIYDANRIGNDLTFGAGVGIAKEGNWLPVSSFNGGAAAFYSAASAAIMNITAVEITLGFWVKITTPAAGFNQWIISKLSGGPGQYQYGLGVSSTGSLLLYLCANGTTITSYTMDPATYGVDLTQWNFVAATCASGGIRFYLNENVETNGTVPAGLFSSTSVLRIGWQVTGSVVLPFIFNRASLNYRSVELFYEHSRAMFGK